MHVFTPLLGDPEETVHGKKPGQIIPVRIIQTFVIICRRLFFLHIFSFSRNRYLRMFFVKPSLILVHPFIRDPERHTDIPAFLLKASAESKRKFRISLTSFSYPLHPFMEFLRRYIQRDHGKLISACPEDLSFIKDSAQHFCRIDKQTVSCTVAFGIIDPLKTIQV